VEVSEQENLQLSASFHTKCTNWKTIKQPPYLGMYRELHFILFAKRIWYVNQ